MSKQRQSDDQMSVEKSKGENLQKTLDEKNEEIRNLQIQLEQNEDGHHRQVESLRDSLQNQKDDFKQMISLLKQEINQKYVKPLEDLRKNAQRIKAVFEQEMLQKHKECKKLHIQHQLEREGLQEQFQFIYAKYKEKKDEIRKLSSAREEDQKQFQGQKHIYEKLLMECVRTGQGQNWLAERMKQNLGD